MNFPTRYFVELILPHISPSVPIYVLQFSYASSMGRFNDHICSVGHVDDVIYTWKIELITDESVVKILYPSETFVKRKQHNRMISNFVKYQ